MKSLRYTDSSGATYVITNVLTIDWNEGHLSYRTLYGFVSIGNIMKVEVNSL